MVKASANIKVEKSKVDANKVMLRLPDGSEVKAMAPFIVSASRSTDIPAFYADWFFYRLKEGYSRWKNPFNGVSSYVSYQNTRFIVFWSKNPRPLLEHLDYLKKRQIECYIQFTLNDYEQEALEKNVPPVAERIDTFKRLVDKLGMGRVIWRFDPLILTDQINEEDLFHKVYNIGQQLKGYTEKLVFSYVDIAAYRKVMHNLKVNGINYREWDEPHMREFAYNLANMNKQCEWNYRLATCAEKIDLTEYGIEHNHCVDDELIVRFAWQIPELMQSLNLEVVQKQPSLLGVGGDDDDVILQDAIKINDQCYAIRKKNNKDKGQRLGCGCVVSKDIGQYNTCPHLCEYCYANASKNMAINNWNNYKHHPFEDCIVSSIESKAPKDAIPFCLQN